MWIQLFINITLSFSIYLLISYSFSMIYSTEGFFNISQAAIITSGAYLTFFFKVQIGLSLAISIIMAIVLSAIIGLLIELGIFKYLRKKKSHPFVLLLSSLGIYIILQNLIALFWGDRNLSIRNNYSEIGNKVAGGFITDIQLITIITSIIGISLFFTFMNNSKLGKKIRAISSDKQLANNYGINVDKVIAITVLISSAIMSLVGILVALDTDMVPTMGFGLLVFGIVAMIIGGIGSTWGLIIGSFVLASAQHFGAYFIDSNWMDAISYIILILILILKPLGFSGKQLKKVEI